MRELERLSPQDECFQAEWKAPRVYTGAVMEAGWAEASPEPRSVSLNFPSSSPNLSWEWRHRNLFRFPHGSFPKTLGWEEKLLRNCQWVWPSLLTNYDLYFNLVNVFLTKVSPWNSALDSKEMCLWNNHCWFQERPLFICMWRNQGWPKQILILFSLYHGNE